MGKGRGKGKKKNNGKNNNKSADNSDDSRSKPKGKQEHKKSSKNHHKNNNYNNCNNNNGYNDHDDIFRQKLEKDGTKKIIEMGADGNCMFRSISDQLYGDYGNNHADIRHDICNWLEKNEETFKHFVVLESDSDEEEGEKKTSNNSCYDDTCEHASSYEDYIERMRQDGNWGGNPELVCAAQFYQRNISVYSSMLEEATPTVFSIESGYGDDENLGEICLSYHDNDHYNSVRYESRNYVNNRLPTTNNNVKTPQEYKKKKRKSEKKKANNNTSDLQRDQNETLKIENDPIPRRNDLCPCGSGMKYKKCCLAAEKRKKRLETIKRKNGLQDEDEDPKRDESIEEEFKVMQI